MSSHGPSRNEFLIGKAGAEQITLKLQEEDPRVFLSSFQAANSISPANDTSFRFDHPFFAHILLFKAVIHKRQ